MLVDIYILNADIAPKKPTGALIAQWGQKAGNSSWFWLQDQVQSLEDQWHRGRVGIIKSCWFNQTFRKWKRCFNLGYLHGSSCGFWMCSPVKEIIILAFVKKMIYFIFALRAPVAVQPTAQTLTAANRSTAKRNDMNIPALCIIVYGPLLLFALRDSLLLWEEVLMGLMQRWWC